jgi:hypothetical protein
MEKKMKKTNPRRRPVTEADVRKARDDAVKEAVHLSSAIFLTVLVDKFDGADHIADVWREVNKLSEEVIEKRVTVADLVHVLKTEYDIYL